MKPPRGDITKNFDDAGFEKKNFRICQSEERERERKLQRGFYGFDAHRLGAATPIAL